MATAVAFSVVLTLMGTANVAEAATPNTPIVTVQSATGIVVD